MRIQGPENDMALPIHRFHPIAVAPRTLVAGLTALALAAGALPALAQDGPARHGPGHPGPAHPGPMHPRPALLTVTGNGQSTAEPDMAQISVGVSTQAATASEAMSENATRQQAVIDRLKAEGIEERDIQTAGLNLSPMQDYSQDGKPPVITGYMAQNTVSVRVRDLAKLGAVLDNLVESGANEISGISFSREDATEAEDAARVDAITAAARRAEVMAQAAGQRLGPIMSISDTEIMSSPGPVMMGMARAEKDSTPIQAGELAISARVTVVYALLPQGGPEGPGGAPAPHAEPDSPPPAPAAPEAAPE